jgi:heat shock protein HslJ
MNLLLPLLLTITASLAMETNQSSVTLPGSAWEVTSFAGQTPLADHPITIEFDTEGNIAGDASCNRFGGSCRIEGDKIEVGPLRSTRRACEPEIMAQEQKFLTLLGAVTAWEIGTDGTLVLRGGGGEIRAKKRTDTPEN